MLKPPEHATRMMASRPFNFTFWLSIPLVTMTLLLIFEPTELDFWITQHFYIPSQGFFARNDYWLESILHDRAKQLVIGFVMLLALTLLLSPRLAALHPWRRQLTYLLLAISLSTAIVPPLKTLTAIQCPWSLNTFGGNEIFVPLFGEHPQTDKPGRCWPGGHASTGFSLLALFFALRDRRPRLARSALLAALGFGAVLSAGRMLQGAHFLSHNLWTLLIDWTICLVTYRLLLYRTAPLGNAAVEETDHQRRAGLLNATP